MIIGTEWRSVQILGVVVAPVSKQEEFEDTKGVIRIHKSKNRQHNGQKKNKNNDLQNTTQKTNDQEPWTPQKPGLSSDALEG